MKCMYCLGKGSLDEQVLWSDGWGMTTKDCPLCFASGELNESPDKIAVRERATRMALETELKNLKVSVALYFATLDGKGNTPEPPLEDAPRPYPWNDVWKKNLQDAADSLPRTCFPKGR